MIAFYIKSKTNASKICHAQKKLERNLPSWNLLRLQSILLKKKQELQQDIFETKQNWDRKVKNREYSKANFWVYWCELHANAKFKMADYSKNSLDLVRTNKNDQPWHCSFKESARPSNGYWLVNDMKFEVMGYWLQMYFKLTVPRVLNGYTGNQTAQATALP